MSDQQRWFKFWCTAPYDDHVQRLPVPDRWAWVVLGAYTKAHGTKGSVSLSETNLTLAAAMGIPVTELCATVCRLPHVNVQKSANGEFTVTWHNWIRFQEDSTIAERVTRLRSKKRGEEKRREEKRIPPTNPPLIGSPPTIPESIQRALQATTILNAVVKLHSVEFWKANIRATNGHIEYAQELLKAEAWLASNPTRAPRKDLARFVHNWLTRAGERL
jgi:hypothetical protein